MNLTKLSARLYAILSLGVILFQLSLVLGAPLGEYAMGGSNPGVYPMSMRFGALLQAVLLAYFTLIVLSRSGQWAALPADKSRRLIWFVVTFAAISLFLNLITPSVRERLLWSPVAFLMLVTSFFVARSRSSESLE